MKHILKNFIVFVILVFAVSSFNGCSDTASSKKVATDSRTAGSPVSNSGAPKKNSDFPPIASAVAQADLRNLDGTTFKVADRKGKVLLLNMWATWCGPCRAEMPALVRMQNKHRDEGFEVIGLNTDEETVEQINEFAGQMNLNYQLVWADTAVQSELLKISRFPGIPQSFVVDRDGNLRGVFRGANPADIRKMEELVADVVAE